MNNDELKKSIEDNQKQADYYADKLLMVNERIVESVNAYDYGRANEQLEFAEELLRSFREYKKAVLADQYELHQKEQK